MDKITREMKRLKETGMIDGTIGARDVGLLIDNWNSNVQEEMLKDFEREINARNKYYWKLWKRAIEDIRAGVKVPPKSERKVEHPFIRWIIK